MALLMPLVAKATNTVFTFAGLAGPPYPLAHPLAPDFTSVTEAGFTVTADQPGWKVSNVFGNPVPAIGIPATGSGVASVHVTKAGDTFTFVGVDLNAAGRGDTIVMDYAITGQLGGQQVFNHTGTLFNFSSNPPFFPITSFSQHLAIDTLTTALSGAPIRYIDNIALGPARVVQVPEPAQASLFAAGALALAALGHLRAYRSLRAVSGRPD